MPTYFRPARVDITEGRGIGGLVLAGAGIAAAAAVAAFVLAHLVLLAGCAAVFVVVMGGIIAAMRWAASPARLRRQLHTRPPVRLVSSRPAQAIPRARSRALAAPLLRQPCASDVPHWPCGPAGSGQSSVNRNSRGETRS